MKTIRPIAHRAFTIIELLVALGVTAVLVTLMLTITINVLNGWNRSSGKLSNESQARLVLDQLSQDLQGAIMKRDANTWLAATLQRNQTSTAGDAAMTTGTPFSSAWSGTVKPVAAAAGAPSLDVNPAGGLIRDYRFGQAGVWLRFFSVPSDNATAALQDTSAPRAIGYQMVRVRVNGSEQYTYALFRSEVRPALSGSNNSTFGVGYDLFMDEATNPSYNNGDASDGNVGNIRRPPGERVIAVNVVDFGLKLYGRDGNAEVELFPVRRNAGGTALNGIPGVPFTYAASYRSPATAPSITGIGGAGNITYGDDTTSPGHTPVYPTSAELMVRILSAEGARLIAALEAGNLPPPPDVSNASEHWWKIVREYSDVFVRRIELKAMPL